MIREEAAVERDSVMKPAFLLMLGRTAAFVATFFIPVILARVFDPAQFGTYKQLFLIYATFFYIAQMGMATSLFYFVPQYPLQAGHYVANSLLFLGLLGLGCFAVLTAAAAPIAAWMTNLQLAPYLPWMGLYIFLSMLSAPLEMVLVARGRYVGAAASYVLSDWGRAIAFIVPVLLAARLEWLLKAGVCVAALRAVMTWIWFRRELPGAISPNASLLKRQLGYAIPLGTACLVEILQSSLPQYLVSAWSDPVTFAIFSVGCLQIPLVDFAASPASDVMMVQMQECIAAGKPGAVPGLWRDTTWKLSLLFFPLVALLLVTAPEVITLLFTSKYAASVPIFAAWSILILLATLQVDGVLRVYAQTRFLLVLNLVRLSVLSVLIWPALMRFHLVGPVLAILVAGTVFKGIALIRIRSLLQVRAADLLPWRKLVQLLASTGAAAVISWCVKVQLHQPLLVLLFSTGVIFCLAYCLLVWQFDLLSTGEKLAIAGWIRKVPGRAAQGFAFGKG